MKKFVLRIQQALSPILILYFVFSVESTFSSQTETPRFILQNGHSSYVYSVAFSPDGEKIVSGGEDHTVKIWETSSGKLLKTLAGHSFPVKSVAFSPDGEKIVSGSGDRTVKIWETSSGKLLKTLAGHFFTVSSVVFSPDGEKIVSGGGDSTVKIRETSSGKLLKTLYGHSSYVSSVAFSRDGEKIVSGGGDNTVKIWETSSGKLLKTLAGHSADVESVAFSPDGEKIVSGGEDHTVKIWETSSGKLLKTLAGHSFTVKSVAFSRDGEKIVSGGGDNTVKIWETSSGKLLKTLLGHSSSVTSVAFSRDGEKIVSGGGDNTVKIWETSSGKLLKTLSGHSSYVTSVSFSRDGEKIVSGGWDETVKIWETSSGKLFKTLAGHSSYVTSVAFSRDGEKIVSGGGDNTVKIWETSSGKLFKTLAGHSSSVSSVSFSRSGEKIVSGGWDNSVKIWETSSGKLLKTLAGHSYYVSSVAFSPDGEKIVSGGGDNTVKIWETSSGKLLKTFAGHSDSVKSVAFSRDGEKIVSGGLDTSMRIWDVGSGKLLLTSYALDKEDYISYTEEGYYVASKHGEKFAAWRIGDEVFTFDQYAEKFNKPELVAKTIIGKNVPAPSIRLAIDTPPKLTWMNQFSSTNESKIKLKLRYKGKAKCKNIIRVFNGKLLKNMSMKNKKEFELNIPLELFQLKNSIVIVATDEKGLYSNGLEINFSYSGGAKGGESMPRREQILDKYAAKYAVIIGISDYKHLKKKYKNADENSKLFDLKYADKDAEAFRDFLNKKEISGGDWEIHLLTNEDASIITVHKVLAKVLKKANQRDLIFIFFSGHGRSDPYYEENVFLLTHEFEPERPMSGFSYQLFRNMIASSKAEHIITFVDSCHSGVIGTNSKGEPESEGSFDQDKMGRLIEKLPENKVLFTSGTGKQRSWEDDELKHGVFTYYLLKGLRGAAKEEKNETFVDLGELAKYVRSKVFEHTINPKNKMSPQNPNLFESRGVINENFPLAIRARH